MYRNGRRLAVTCQQQLNKKVPIAGRGGLTRGWSRHFGVNAEIAPPLKLEMQLDQP
jgi:hypothetical protein